MSKQVKQERIFGTLRSREVRPIRNWHEFLAFWGKEETGIYDRMLGLLHVGFNVSLERGNWDEPDYDEIDRIRFYLAIADGWTNYLTWADPRNDVRYQAGYDEKGYPVNKTGGELRQELARKAFDILAQKFFRGLKLLDGGSRGDELNNAWYERILSPQLFSDILNFFRSETRGESGSVVIRNISLHREMSHNEQFVIDFLLNLAQFLWSWERKESQKCRTLKQKELWEFANKERRSRVEMAKPWMIEVLNYIRRLDVLREWLLELNEPCLAKLKEIALRSKLSTFRHSVRENRPAVSIEEACYVDSAAGWLLKEYELKRAEQARLKEIREAEEARENADRRIRILSSPFLASEERVG